MVSSLRVAVIVRSFPVGLWMPFWICRCMRITVLAPRLVSGMRFPMWQDNWEENVACMSLTYVTHSTVGYTIGLLRGNDPIFQENFSLLHYPIGWFLLITPIFLTMEKNAMRYSQSLQQDRQSTGSLVQRIDHGGFCLLAVRYLLCVHQ